MDDRKSSFFHLNNFDTSHDFSSYGIDMWNREKQIILQVLYDSQNVSWSAHIAKYVNKQGVVIEGGGNCGMKGSSLEARFSLSTIEGYLGKLGTGEFYVAHARIVYRSSPGKYLVTDSSPMKTLAF